jgi:hypothetical protein
MLPPGGRRASPDDYRHARFCTRASPEESKRTERIWRELEGQSNGDDQRARGRCSAYRLAGAAVVLVEEPMNDKTREQIEAEGRQAYRNNRAASEGPYSFCNTPYYPNDTDGFNRNARWKLDAWMRGWIEQRRNDDPPRKPTGRQRGAK